MLTFGVTLDGVTRSKTKEITNTNIVSLEDSVANGQTNKEYVLALDQSQLNGLYIWADGAITLKTNSSGSPDDTLAVPAGIPYVWCTGMLGTLLITADVSKIFITNASGGVVNFIIKAIQDGTP